MVEAWYPRHRLRFMYSRDKRAKLIFRSWSSAWGVVEVTPMTEIKPLTSRGRALGQGMEPIKLPAPQTDGGKPLMQALEQRHSTREFSAEALPPQVLSNLLWAAAGVNRPASGQRTVPSARDWREIDVYVFVYDDSPVFDEFLAFKESVWGNNLIPYIRYYRRGRLRSESNYLSPEAFLDQLA